MDDQRVPKEAAVCGKHIYYARDCKYNKSQTEANDVQVDDNIVIIFSEIMTIKYKVQGWWYDTCITVHVSYDKRHSKPILKSPMAKRFKWEMKDVWE